MDTAAVLLGILIGLALGAFAGWLIGILFCRYLMPVESRRDLL